MPGTREEVQWEECCRGHVKKFNAKSVAEDTRRGSVQGVLPGTREVQCKECLPRTREEVQCEECCQGHVKKLDARSVASDT